MRRYFIMFYLTLIGCHSNQSRTLKKPQLDDCNVYPSTVDSLKVKDLYDSARWYVYTLQCDKKYLPKSDTSKSVTFGELPLGFRDLISEHDTIIINLDFMDNNKPIISGMTRDYKQLSTGVGFDINTRKKIFMVFSGGIQSEKGSKTRYENPMQPEVVKYIRNNWDKLNECFRELAEQKGISK